MCGTMLTGDETATGAVQGVGGRGCADLDGGVGEWRRAWQRGVEQDEHLSQRPGTRDGSGTSAANGHFSPPTNGGLPVHVFSAPAVDKYRLRGDTYSDRFPFLVALRDARRLLTLTVPDHQMLAVHVTREAFVLMRELRAARAAAQEAESRAREADARARATDARVDALIASRACCTTT